MRKILTDRDFMFSERKPQQYFENNEIITESIVLISYLAALNPNYFARLSYGLIKSIPLYANWCAQDITEGKREIICRR